METLSQLNDQIMQADLQIENHHVLKSNHMEQRANVVFGEAGLTRRVCNLSSDDGYQFDPEKSTIYMDQKGEMWATIFGFIKGETRKWSPIVLKKT